MPKFSFATMIAILALIALAACSSSDPSSATTAGVQLSLDGTSIEVKSAKIVEEDGHTVIRTTTDVEGRTRLDITPGTGVGDKVCTSKSVVLFDPANGSEDLNTLVDASCKLNVTANGETGTFAGTFAGQLAGKSGARKIQLSWNVAR